MLKTLVEFIKTSIKRRFRQIDLDDSLARISRQGYAPDAIFDVGAHHGEFAAKAHHYWPHASIFSFEVLPEAISVLRKLNYINVVPTLVGAEDRAAVTFHVADTASSVLEEHADQHFPTISVPMQRLDTFVRQHKVVPSLLKIDTQGFEYPVLQGAQSILPQVDLILAELNFLDIHRDVRLAPEVIGLLWQQGFVPFDITELHRRPLDNALWQADFLFCRQDFFLRKDKRWNAAV